MRFSVIYTLTVGIVSVNAAPTPDNAVSIDLHGTPAEVQLAMENSWQAWAKVNGTDVPISLEELAPIMQRDIDAAEEAKRLGKRCSWNDGIGGIDW